MSSAIHAPEIIGLSVSNLVIKYGDITAVDHVSFTAQSGRVTVILGPNGAGKTSTIEACEGFLAPTAGSIQVLGLDPFLQRKQLNRQMGIMLQEGGIYPSARVAELVQQYCVLYGNGVNAHALISRVGLQSVTSTTYRRLSGGEKQRLSLALALAARPQIIFLDEPTSGIDVNGRDLVRSIIRELRDSGCCVIVQLTDWAKASNVDIRDIGAGSQRLDDVFRRLTSESAS